MDMNKQDTWPDELLDHLRRHQAVFRAWELQKIGAQGGESVSGPDYDRALGELRKVLNNYTLHRYHCTRLIRPEIARIRSSGMQLPNEAMLHQRIESLRDGGLLDAANAAELIADNEAAEKNRAGRIWFCFFPPNLDSETGLSDLLSYWGGESLYNSHDTHAVRGPLLAGIGTPCLVEAEVPISSLRGPSFLDMKVARQFLIWNGLQTSEPVLHTDCAIEPLPARSILRIIEFPGSDFTALTGCDAWQKQLTVGRG
ncbi:hypothetical protein [Bradyrhizobium elkanii]